MTRPKDNPIFNREIGDVIAADVGEKLPVGRIKYTTPTEVHPIARFFSERARYNAANMRIQGGRMYNPLAISDASEFHSRQSKRPPNPDYFFELDAPYPVGYEDHNGSSMSFAWTPLAYMLYYDRSNNNRNEGYRNEVYTAATTGKLRKFRLDLWTALFLKGVWWGENHASLAPLARALAYTDPPVEWMVEMMWPPEHENRTNGQCWEFAAAARDFQHNWNCGAWFDGANQYGTATALGRLLNI